MLPSNFQQTTKEQGESASGDNISPSRTAAWKRFRGCQSKTAEKKNNNTEKKNIKIEQLQKESKEIEREFTDISGLPCK